MKFFDRVKTTTTTAGTGAITCNAAAASSELRTLAGAGAAVADVFPYAIGIAGSAEWECGLGTITAISSGAVTFSRMPTASSNAGALVNFSAGTKEVVCTPLGSTLTKWESSTSVRVVYLSNYCASDTNLSATAPQSGADQRAKIQAVLDMAQDGPLRIVWDVKATVANVSDGSGNTLLVRSNTEINVLNGCGALQAAGSIGWMISNANPTTNADKTNANNIFSKIVDENITINGGTWNGNRGGQNGVKNDIFHWSGVRNLRTENYRIVNGSGMAHRLINTDGHKNFHYEIDFGEGNAIVNSDGMHYHGPARNIRDRGGRILNCGDDAYALNADDAWGEANFTGPFDNVYGPIEDVTVEDLYIRSSVFAVRLLSGQSRINDVRFKNVRGSTTGYGFVIDNYLTPSKCVLPGPGNFGNIEIDGWHMTNAVHNPNASWYQMSMHINAKVEQLSMKSITKSDFNNIYFPIIRFGEKYKGDQLAVELSSRNYNGGTYLAEQIDFATGATVTQADIKVRTYSSSPIAGSPVRVQVGATISQLTIDGQAPNFTSMLNNQGTITTLMDRTAASTVAAPATTWALQSGAPWVEDVSNPGSLTYAGPKSGVVASAKKIAADAFNGQVKVSDSVTFTGSASFINGFHSALVVRGSSMVPWSGVQQGYFVDMFLEGGGGIKINKAVAGTQSDVSSQITVPFVLNVEYLRTFQAKTNTSTGVTTLTVTIQRVSDGLYLQSNGTWSNVAGPAITATDSSIPAASGEWGVYDYNEGNTNCNIVHKIISIAAAD